MRWIFVLTLVLLALLPMTFADNSTIDISGAGVEYQIIRELHCNTSRECFDAINWHGGRGELARCNELYHLCEMPVSTGSGFNLSWQIVVLIVAAIVFIGFLVFMQYKHEKPKKRFTNPYIVAILATLALALTIFVMEAAGILEPGWSHDNAIIFVGLLLATFFSVATYLKYIKPLDYPKLKLKAVRFLWENFKAKPYEGHGFDDGLMACEYSDTKEDNKMLNKVINFLFLAESSTIKTYLITLAIMDGEVRRFRINPTMKDIKKIFSREIAADIDLERRYALQGFIDEPSIEPQRRNQNDIL